MKNIFAIIILIPSIAISAGYGGAEGKNKLGEIIHIADDTELKIYVQKNENDHEWKEEYLMKNECPNFDFSHRFSCITKSKSPLAGTTYKITTSNKWKPCKDNSEYPSNDAGTVYICVKGCNIHSPKIFYETPWEC